MRKGELVRCNMCLRCQATVKARGLRNNANRNVTGSRKTPEALATSHAYDKMYGSSGQGKAVKEQLCQRNVDSTQETARQLVLDAGVLTPCTEKQITAFARAILSSPLILSLRDPLSNLYYFTYSVKVRGTARSSPRGQRGGGRSPPPPPLAP